MRVATVKAIATQSKTVTAVLVSYSAHFHPIDAQFLYRLVSLTKEVRFAGAIKLLSYQSTATAGTPVRDRISF